MTINENEGVYMFNAFEYIRFGRLVLRLRLASPVAIAVENLI